jgi:hypothetical protein
MATQTPVNLVQQKLEAFEQIQPEFEASFCFVQDVHGQRRFSTFPVQETVHYLHALWICECKDRLLSVYKNITRYEGQLCLSLLQRWQAGESAEVVAFLQRKLDGMPFAELTRQIQAAQLAHSVDSGLVRRLAHGRQILLNRGMNLMQALDALFVLQEDVLLREVQAACRTYRHSPSQIEQQLVAMKSPLYTYVPHQCLAQQNMVVMNTLGMAVMTLPTDLPGERSGKVLVPKEPLPPFAEHVVMGYVELTAPWHNNLNAHRFFDRPEQMSGQSL